MDIILLRLEAPMMSFGGPAIDQNGIIQGYPALSMICGLVANALGYHHRETDRLQRLQQRIRYAARLDRPGARMRDFQTVDLGQPSMLDDHAWTTRGRLQKRGGGSARKGTHIRYRDYWADASATVALALRPPDEAPTADELARALATPERPLFIGRKCCLPATPLLLGRSRAPDLRTALVRAPLADDVEPADRLPAWWPTAADVHEPDALKLPVTDARDWVNQIHVGQRWIAVGHVQPDTQEGTND